MFYFFFNQFFLKKEIGEWKFVFGYFFNLGNIVPSNTDIIANINPAIDKPVCWIGMVFVSELIVVFVVVGLVRFVESFEVIVIGSTLPVFRL